MSRACRDRCGDLLRCRVDRRACRRSAGVRIARTLVPFGGSESVTREVFRAKVVVDARCVQHRVQCRDHGRWPCNAIHRRTWIRAARDATGQILRDHRRVDVAGLAVPARARTPRPLHRRHERESQVAPLERPELLQERRVLRSPVAGCRRAVGFNVRCRGVPPSARCCGTA